MDKILGKKGTDQRTIVISLLVSIAVVWASNNVDEVEDYIG